MKTNHIKTTQNSRDIMATPEIIYGAFTNPEALENRMGAGEMTGRIHRRYAWFK